MFKKTILAVLIGSFCKGGDDDDGPPQGDKPGAPPPPGP